MTKEYEGKSGSAKADERDVVTRVLTPLEVLVARAKRVGKPVININLAIDVSGSMGDEAVQYLMGEGLRRVFGRIADNGRELHAQPIVRVTVFSGNVRQVVPWLLVEEAIDFVEEVPVEKASGCTRLDLAIENAISSITQIKEAEEQGKVPRNGSVSMVLTDGWITDDRGNSCTFPGELERRIGELSASRSVSSIAIGIGGSDRDLLRKIAPPTTRKGKVVANALQLMGSIDELDWDALIYFMAEGSSKSAHGGFRQEGRVVHNGVMVS